MANGTDSHETPDARTVDVEQLMAAMSGLTQGQIEAVLQGLLAARAPLRRLFEATPPPSRRRPRRPDVVTYRVRIDLKGTRPPLWRRLEAARCRFDVVSVTLQADGRADIGHVRGAFDAIE